MIPKLRSIKTFLPIARLYGYSFINHRCTKTIIYDVLDCIIEININLVSGLIVFKAYASNKTVRLTIADKKYLTKDICHLIEWREED